MRGSCIYSDEMAGRWMAEMSLRILNRQRIVGNKSKGGEILEGRELLCISLEVVRVLTGAGGPTNACAVHPSAGHR